MRLPDEAEGRPALRPGPGVLARLGPVFRLPGGRPTVRRLPEGRRRQLPAGRSYPGRPGPPPRRCRSPLHARPRLRQLREPQGMDRPAGRSPRPPPRAAPILPGLRPGSVAARRPPDRAGRVGRRDRPDARRTAGESPGRGGAVAPGGRGGILAHPGRPGRAEVPGQHPLRVRRRPAGVGPVFPPRRRPGRGPPAPRGGRRLVRLARRRRGRQRRRLLRLGRRPSPARRSRRRPRSRRGGPVPGPHPTPRRRQEGVQEPTPVGTGFGLQAARRGRPAAFRQYKARVRADYEQAGGSR